MTDRFVYRSGVISVTNGASTIYGTATAWAGRDREGSQVWIQPDDGPPVRIGTIAAVEPRGEYDNTELPLVSPWNGPTLDEVAYELIDGPAIANGVTQAAIYARFAAHLESRMGLVGNTGDDIDWELVPENSAFIDAVTRRILQWRNGLLRPVHVVGIAFNPMGDWDHEASYDQSDMVSYGGYLYVSNMDGNEDNEPGGSPPPQSNAFWTHYPTPGVADVLAALGINSVTISTDDPAGGVDTDLWLKVV